MNILKILYYVFVAICLIRPSEAMESSSEGDKVLIIGCRPWDANMKEYSKLDTAHFVDFMLAGAPEPIPNRFYHLDLNDTGLNDTGFFPAGKFSEFAKSPPKKFNIIIIDWGTYHHVRRDGAWADFASLLNPEGSLIVPISSQNFMTGASTSEEKAEALKENKLKGLFQQTNLHVYNPEDKNEYSELLNRPSLELEKMDSLLRAKPIIIEANHPISLHVYGSEDAYNYNKYSEFPDDLPSLESGKMDSLLSEKPIIIEANSLKESEVKFLASISECKDTSKNNGTYEKTFAKLTFIPGEVFNFTSLVTLNLSYNQLQELPPEIGNLASLVALNLSHNQLRVLPSTIGKLASLSQLDISHNSLDTLPDSVGEIPYLTTLKLSGNRLKNLPASFGKLAFLNDLDLSHNQLELLPVSFTELMLLNKLDIKYNRTLENDRSLTLTKEQTQWMEERRGKNLLYLEL